MMFIVQWGIVLALVCGCYAPVVPSGVPCSAEGTCPGNQECVAGICGGIPGSGDAQADDGPIDPDAPEPDAPLSPWAVPIRVSVLSTPSDDRAPSLFQNGLRIYIASEVTNGISPRIFYASRASVQSPFSAPVAAGEIDQPDEDEYHPEVSMAGLELHFVSSDGVRGIRQTTRVSTGAPWTAPPTNLGHSDREAPSLAAGDTRMVVSRNTGGIEEYERPQASGPWTLVRVHNNLDNMRSPGISADGLEIYATLKASDQLFRATRGSLNAQFGQPVRVLFGDSLDNRPIYDPELSSDGRTMYLAIEDGADFDIYVTTR